MALQELIELSSVRATRIPEHAASIRVTSVECDSRAVAPNALFCAIRGRNSDGHDFAVEAQLAGASAILVDHLLPIDMPQILVADTAAATGALSSAFLGHPSHQMRVLGVTGTNGKTTVTHLLEAISIAAGKSTGVVGTIETRFVGQTVASKHTTPDQCSMQQLFAAMLDAGVRDVAIEVSSHALDQSRVTGTRFAVVCFTNLGRDHLDYHESMGAYGAAKARLFTSQYAPVAAINVNDDFGAALKSHAELNGVDVWTYGARASDVYVEDVRFEAACTKARVVCVRTDDEFEIETPLVGAFNVENALCAITAHLAIGTPTDVIVRGLGSAQPIPGRLERVSGASDTCNVFVDYAHTPDALTAVIAALRPIAVPGAMLRVVFGCGGERDRTKRPEMARVVAAGADSATITSDNPRGEAPESIVADALANWPQHLVVPKVVLDRRSAIEQVLRDTKPGDIVLIAGKGHEVTQTIGDQTIPFDDRAIAREILARLR